MQEKEFIMIENIIYIIFLAVIVEYLTNILKQFIPDSLETEFPIPLLISLVLGITLGLFVRVDVLSALGFEPVNQTVSYITTGLIASGGSTAVHELIAKLRASREDL